MRGRANSVRTTHFSFSSGLAGSCTYGQLCKRSSYQRVGWHICMYVCMYVLVHQDVFSFLGKYSSISVKSAGLRDTLCFPTAFLFFAPPRSCAYPVPRRHTLAGLLTVICLSFSLSRQNWPSLDLQFSKLFLSIPLEIANNKIKCGNQHHQPKSPRKLLLLKAMPGRCR